jgi:beta-phosphoglucomutase-like phosphatase (HAD superfamily)
MNSMPFTLAVRDFDAVLFDLDGVVAQTANLHAAAWKRLFDDYLRHCAAREGRPFRRAGKGARPAYGHTELGRLVSPEHEERTGHLLDNGFGDERMIAL